MIPGSMIATGSCALWDRLSDVGDWVVVLFGLLLWASCIFGLFCLGVRAMSTRRYKQVKHKRLPRVQTTRSNPAIAWRLISRVVAGPMRRLFPIARVRARSPISATEGDPTQLPNQRIWVNRRTAQWLERRKTCRSEGP
jgi:hypothetical protein